MEPICLLEQTLAAVPLSDEWLDAWEAHVLSRLRFEKRRSDWRLGRWTAKNAIAERLGLSRDLHALRAIRIETETGGAPFATIGTSTVSVAISISHSSGVAICAVAYPAVPVGCDLERVETRSAAFELDNLTPAELDLINGLPTAERDLAATLCWSAKESTLKAIGAGLRVDTRSVAISLPGFDGLSGEGGWKPVKSTLLPASKCWWGWWQFSNGFVKTLVSCPPPLKPVTLRLSGKHLCRDVRLQSVRQ